jgi:hypothetical protein
MTKIAINPFVLRQTPGSPYTHFDGGWEKLVILVHENLDRSTQGYKKGVSLVPVPAEGFWSSTIAVTSETKLRALFSARREGENKFVSVRATGKKEPAKYVFVVLYSREVLDENDEGSDSTAAWEIVSINGRQTEEEEPMHPLTMARNFLELPGGTKGEYTPEQFAKAIVFWAEHVLVDLE